VNSDTDLLPQLDKFQQTPLIKKRGNSSWRYFSILLIVINLLFIWPFGFLYLLPLAIIDFIAFTYFVRKKTPPWKTFLIFLLILNVTFFYLAGWVLNQSTGAVAGIVIVPIALFLLLIDFIVVLMVLSYVYRNLTNVKAKVTFYIALVSIVLGLFALSVLYSAHT